MGLFDGGLGLDRCVAGSGSVVWDGPTGNCGSVLPEISDTIWTSLFLDTDNGRSCNLGKNGQEDFGSEIGFEVGNGGSEILDECGGSFPSLVVSFVSCFLFLSKICGFVKLVRDCLEGGKGPGGLADEALGRLFSEICHDFQADEGLHFSMYANSSLFLLGEGLVWYLALLQSEKQYPLMFQRVQTFFGLK